MKNVSTPRIGACPATIRGISSLESVLDLLVEHSQAQAQGGLIDTIAPRAPVAVARQGKAPRVRTGSGPVAPAEAAA